MGLAQDPLKAVLDADTAHPDFTDRRSDDRPDRSVQPRRIAAARQDTDLLIHKSRATRTKFYFTAGVYKCEPSPAKEAIDALIIVGANYL